MPEEDQFLADLEILSLAAEEDPKLEGGCTFPLEELEELRLFLSQFLDPEVLTAINNVYRVLESGLRETEKYSWFVRNGVGGGDCKFALQALKKFKEKKLDLLEENLLRALSQVRKLKE